MGKPIEGNHFIREEDEIKKYKYPNIKFKNSFRFEKVKLNYKSCWGDEKTLWQNLFVILLLKFKREAYEINNNLRK